MLTMPKIGFGTWMRRGAEGQRSIEAALARGYRHIDTAQGYENEGICGLALAQSGLKRDEVFITTKLKHHHAGRDLFLPTVEESLVRLRVDRVDLLLIHWPPDEAEVPMASYIADLVRVRELGLASMIGFSNFTQALIQRAEAIAGRGAFEMLQIEAHPFHQNRAMARFCAERGMSVTAFSPLALGRVASDPVLLAIAAEVGGTPAQVALAFLIGRGFAVIPASARPEHMADNLQAGDLVLTAEQMARIDGLERGQRLLSPDHAPDWD